jgi:hypothetical protein
LCLYAPQTTLIIVISVWRGYVPTQYMTTFNEALTAWLSFSTLRLHFWNSKRNLN